MWDKEICKDASLDDIDWNFIKEVFIPLYEKTTGKETAGKVKDILIPLGCIRKGKPTRAGILLFGKKPLKYFMNSYIALARYKGEMVGGERLDYKAFEGNIFNQIDKCNEYIREHTAMMSRLKPGNVRRQDIPEYGLFSVRELITNAVSHRKYENQHSKIIIKMFDNKIEFYNPGGLPEGITPRNITKEQNSRNPTIAKVLAKVEYIEEVGEGWDKIIKEHKEHPLNPNMPKIESSEHSVTVTLFSTKEKFETKKKEIILNERQKKIIKFLEENRMIITRKCAELLNVSEDTALRELSQLKRLNLIERKGIGRGVYYVIK